MTGLPASPGTHEAAATQLARREDFLLARARVRPSLRMVEGPLGSAKGEPRVIQVLLALADAQGKVLSREELLRVCWDGRIVGDDAINRAIAEVRRIAASVGAEFEVETVPRVGYRLTGVDWDLRNEPAALPGPGSTIDRRRLIVAGSSAAGLLALVGAALIFRERSAETDRIIERGRVLQGSGGPNDDRRAEVMFRQAIRRDPDRADAWGWLATVESNPQLARDAADRALQIDPREPNARAVLAFQRRDLDAWMQWEDTLLGVLDDAPGNAMALTHLTLFYQGMGRCRDSWVTNERAIVAEPFNPIHQGRRALKHWIFGRIGEADKVLDRSLQLWPGNPTIWNARLITYAFTGRTPAANALLDDPVARPVNLTEPSIRTWRAALAAIATRSRKDVANAVQNFVAVAPLAPGLAANAIMVCSYLGELDTAYRVASGLLTHRGAVIQRTRGSGINDVYSGSVWGRTQFLFIPATDAFRKDARFPDLCRQMGHVAYWRRRGVWPDPFVRGALDPAKMR